MHSQKMLEKIQNTTLVLLFSNLLLIFYRKKEKLLQVQNILHIQHSQMQQKWDIIIVFSQKLFNAK